MSEQKSSFGAIKTAVSKIADSPRRVWLRIVLWIERGNLIPGLLLIAIPHYVEALSRYDHPVVATALGTLVDLGHFRVVQIFLSGIEKNSRKKKSKHKTWIESILAAISSMLSTMKSAFWMIVMTAITYTYHLQYYQLNDSGNMPFIYAATIPTMIFALSIISRNNHLATRAQRALDKGQINRKQKSPGAVVAPSEKQEPAAPKATITTYDQYKHLCLSRDGTGPMTYDKLVKPVELKREHHVPNTTAYRYLDEAMKEFGIEKPRRNVR